MIFYNKKNKKKYKTAKILTNSKHLVDMKSYDYLNLGIACGYKWILIILNKKWDNLKSKVG